LRALLDALLLGDFADDDDAADDVARVVAEGAVHRLGEAASRGLRDCVAPRPQGDLFPLQGPPETLPLPFVREAREELEGDAPEGLVVAKSVDALHPHVPGGEAEFTVEACHAVKARVEEHAGELGRPRGPA